MKDSIIPKDELLVQGNKLETQKLGEMASTGEFK